jgi:hypothetical protein
MPDSGLHHKQLQSQHIHRMCLQGHTRANVLSVEYILRDREKVKTSFEQSNGLLL